MEKQPGFLRLRQPRHAPVSGQAVTAVISLPVLQAGAVPAPGLLFPLYTAQCNCKGQLQTHLCWRTQVQRQIHAVPYHVHPTTRSAVSSLGPAILPEDRQGTSTASPGQ